MKTLKKELKSVAQYAQSFFEEYKRPDLVYHNAVHTKAVVQNAQQIAKKYDLSQEEYYIIMAAAWLHDLGYYVNNSAVNHEVESAKLAVDYLKSREFEDFIIEGVKNCILATQLPQAPQNLLEEIVCDADLFHLGTDEFMDNQKLLRREMSFLKQDKIDKHIWLKDTTQLMYSHNYHTPYCQDLLTKGKTKNLKKLRDRVEELEKKEDAQLTEQPSESTALEPISTPETAAPTKTRARAKSARQKTYAITKPNPVTTTTEDADTAVEIQPNSVSETAIQDDTMTFEDAPDKTAVEAPVKETQTFGSHEALINESDNEYLFFKKKVQKQDDEKDKKKTSRGVETVFRVTSSNNQQLSAQADNKANIMITVNSIIISVLLTVLVSRIEEQPNLLLPTIVLLLVNVSTIIFSVLATRPNIPTGMFNDNDVETKKVNLLFFGNFYRMNLENYAKGMVAMMDDRDFLYGSLIQDVYNQGLVLAKKYRLLRISYSIFMYGLIVSVVAFVISSVFFAPQTVIH